MPRKADTDLSTKTARLKLTARKDGYYANIAPGKSLGYIRRADQAGSWVVREKVNGVYQYARFALADDLGEANGVDVLTHAQALKKAASEAVGPTVKAPSSMTVGDAVKAYYDRAAIKDPNAEQYRKQLNKRMTKELAEIQIVNLTYTTLDAWFQNFLVPNPDFPKRRLPKKSTCNRVLGQLKSTLTFAFRDRTNNIPSSAAWDLVEPHSLKNEKRARDLDLTFEEVSKLIAAAATFSKDLATFLQATFLTGARAPSELAALNVSHFDAKRGRLEIQGRSPGVRSKTGSRIVRLDAASVAFFTECAKDKLPNAPLLTMDGERHPTGNEHYDPIKRAAKLAGLPSQDKGGVCLYTLRHSHISRAVESGADYKALALNCGTSVEMIVDHYAHLRDEFQNEQAQKHGVGAALAKATLAA